MIALKLASTAIASNLFIKEKYCVFFFLFIFPLFFALEWVINITLVYF